MFVLVFTTLMLTACAGASKTTRPEAGPAGSLAALQERAEARWQLLIEGKMVEAYAYLTPGYRATRSVDDYVVGARAGALNWESVEWREADCQSEDSCLAQMLLNYSVRMPGAGRAPGFRVLAERWLHLDGEWYHLPER